MQRLNHRPKKALGFKKNATPGAQVSPASQVSIEFARDDPRASCGRSRGGTRWLARLFEDTEDIRVVSIVGDGKQAVAEALRVNPDVIVMDISMPVMSGISATRDILERAPQSRVSCSRYTRRRRYRSVAAIGARGYVLKESAGDEVGPRSGPCRGKTIPWAKVSQKRIFRRLGNICLLGQGVRVADTPWRGLLRLYHRRKSNAQAGLILRLSPRTVETYRSRSCRNCRLRICQRL